MSECDKGLKQAALSLVTRWQEQEHIPEIIRRLHEAVVQCNPLDYEQIEQEFFSEGGIAEISQHAHLKSFTFGVRFAERIHGVTENCKEDK